MELWFVSQGSSGQLVLLHGPRCIGALLCTGSQEEVAPFLHSSWSYSLTKSKNFWFCGCCSLILLQWPPPRSAAAWNTGGGVLANLFRRAFPQDMCAYSVEVFFVPLPLKPWILFLWFPLKYCKICIWHWVATAHTSLSQHEPAQEFVISVYSRTVLQTISSYFGVDPVCWKLPSKEMTLAKKEAETGLQIHPSVEEVLLAMFVDAQATGM